MEIVDVHVRVHVRNDPGQHNTVKWHVTHHPRKVPRAGIAEVRARTHQRAPAEQIDVQRAREIDSQTMHWIVEHEADESHVVLVSASQPYAVG